MACSPTLTEPARWFATAKHTETIFPRIIALNVTDELKDDYPEPCDTLAKG
jgi:hypothetical protein